MDARRNESEAHLLAGMSNCTEQLALVIACCCPFQVHGWARNLRPILGKPPEPPIIKEAYCCTQFMVSRDRIRARPHSFWRTMLADLLDDRVPETCKISGHSLEVIWGYLLGEPADFKCRSDGWGAEGRKGAL